MGLILTSIMLQNLGLESVGVKMNKNGAIEVVLFLPWSYHYLLFYGAISVNLFIFLPHCFFRLMNTHVLQYLPYGL